MNTGLRIVSGRTDAPTPESDARPTTKLQSALWVALAVSLWSGLFAGLPAVNGADTDNSRRIQPWSNNPRYWQYEGRPVLLLGGSKDDNLFQIPDLRQHLDEMVAVGANYIRNTMSDRHDMGFEVYPFRQLPEGKYDLDQWNEEYWNRFANLLRWTRERSIFVQIEVWDRFDYSQDNWLKHPYNPSNNVNYTAAQSGLATAYPAPAWRDRQPFFHTIPGMAGYRRNYDRVRHYQERFVARILSLSLDYGHVLYCMNNETSTHEAWGQHWMKFIQERAADKGVLVFTTDMFDDVWAPRKSAKLKQAIEQPSVYPFIEVSQVNSRTFNEDHWNNVHWIAQQIQGSPRPLNHTKVYSDGQTTWGSGTPKDGVERFWRNLLAGAASCRFHRPGGGIGLNQTAQACLRAARKVESLIRFWEVESRMDLLSDRESDEAYLAADPGTKYILFFSDGGSVSLDLNAAGGPLTLRWVNISTGEWGRSEELAGRRVATIAAPSQGPWVAAIAQAIQ